MLDLSGNGSWVVRWIGAVLANEMWLEQAKQTTERGNVIASFKFNDTGQSVPTFRSTPWHKVVHLRCTEAGSSWYFSGARIRARKNLLSAGCSVVAQ
jgi:hypothetical protein